MISCPGMSTSRMEPSQMPAETRESMGEQALMDLRDQNCAGGQYRILGAVLV